MRIRNKIAVTVGAAALFGGMASGTASADSGPVYVCCGEAPAFGGGMAWFKSWGDHLFIKDLAADGHSVVVRIVYPGHEAYYWNAGGKGTTRDVNFNMPEGAHVQYTVCVGEYSNKGVMYNTCGGDAVDTA